VGQGRDQRAEDAGRSAARCEEAPAAEQRSPSEVDDLARVGKTQRVMREAVERMGTARKAIDPPRQGGRDAAHGARGRSTTAVP
jgi:hypothetical protein